MPINLPDIPEATLSKDRVVPGSCKIPLGVFPPSSNSHVDVDKISSRLVDGLNNALRAHDAQALGSLFHENSYWRDHLCLSWDLRTLKGREKIVAFATSSTTLQSVDIDRTSQFRAPKQGPIDGIYGPASEVSGIEFFVKVTTKVGSGRGVIKLAEVDGQWKFFTVFTTLQELNGHEENIFARRPNGAAHGEHVGRLNWFDNRKLALEYKDREPAVLIVGEFITDETASSCRLLLTTTDRGRSEWPHFGCSSQGT